MPMQLNVNFLTWTPRPVRRAYNFAEYLPEHRRMMQAWVDYLDQLAGRKPK